jgi:riboflavin biosynthesis pyrimidine reductase
MLRRGLIDEAWAYVAPMILGDRAARAIEAAGVRGTIDEADRFRSIDTRRFGADTRLVLRRAEPLAPLDGTPAP